MKTVSRSIGNHTYKVTALGALKGRAVFVMLVRLLGASAEHLKKDTLAEALGDLAANLTEADLAFLCDTFAKSTDVVMPDGREPQLAGVFDLHFSDNYLEMVQWLVFCIEVNFSSFFHGLPAKLGKGVSGTPAVKSAP